MKIDSKNAKSEVKTVKIGSITYKNRLLKQLIVTSL